MKFILKSETVAEHSEQLRVLFDYAIKNFGSIKVVNEFSELPNGVCFEWGETRYVEIPMDYAPESARTAFFNLAKSQNILVEQPTDLTPQKITW